MVKIYYLATCSTCKRIIKELQLGPEAVFQDIKTEKITEAQLEKMYQLAGSYEALFSKRAMKYREWGLNEKVLNEEEYRDYILQEYTFLKRPVIVMGDKIFIGSAAKVVAAAKEALGGS